MWVFLDYMSKSSREKSDPYSRRHILKACTMKKKKAVTTEYLKYLWDHGVALDATLSRSPFAVASTTGATIKDTIQFVLI